MRIKLIAVVFGIVAGIAIGEGYVAVLRKVTRSETSTSDIEATQRKIHEENERLRRESARILREWEELDRQLREMDADGGAR